MVKEGTLLAEPNDKVKQEAIITDYISWLNERNGLSIDAYDELSEWSVDHL